MNYKKKIINYLNKSGGIITSEYCRGHNIPTVYLSRLSNDGVITKVKNGIYITENGDYDELYFFQYNYKKAIYSYETALYLIGQTDKIPWTNDITVYNGYKFNEKPMLTNVHYVNKYIYELGIEEVDTMFGNKVKTYSYERILCDFILNKKDMDPEVYSKLIMSYPSYDKRNLDLLYYIASKMKIENKVRDIMEVVYE